MHGRILISTEAALTHSSGEAEHSLTAHVVVLQGISLLSQMAWVVRVRNVLC